MVGVKGKYKGCNTCRKRRVACDNTRPYCRRCTDHDRTCDGYYQETVFIFSTPENKGRCSSHPARTTGQRLRDSQDRDEDAEESRRVKRAKTTEDQVARTSPRSDYRSSRSRSRLSGDELAAEDLGRAPTEYKAALPYTPAWEETITLDGTLGPQQYRFVALHTNLHNFRPDDSSGSLTLDAALSRRLDVLPTSAEANFWENVQCQVRSPMVNMNDRRTEPQNALGDGCDYWKEGVLLFLYQHNSANFGNGSLWKGSDMVSDPVQQLGPGQFRTFPSHQFFARVYRPNAIFASIFAHQPSPLSAPEWQTVPFEHHPKCPLDSLLDIISQIPALLDRSDRVLPLPPSIGRCFKAKELLASCAAVDREFENWYNKIEEEASRNKACPLLYWARGCKRHYDRTTEGHGQDPFIDTYNFPSAMLGLAHIYYWVGLIVLHGIMGGVYDAAFGNTSRPLPLPMEAFRDTAPLTQPPTLPTHPYPRTFHDSPPGVFSSYSMARPAAALVSAQSSAQSYPESSSMATLSPSIRTIPYGPENDLPAGIDQAKYCIREVRKLAANVCRSLDWAVGSISASSSSATTSSSFSPSPYLGFDGSDLSFKPAPAPVDPASPSSFRGAMGPLGQPDLVAAPFLIVQRFYEAIRVPGEGEIEVLWCLSFKERFEERCRAVERHVLGAHGPTEFPAGNKIKGKGIARGAERMGGGKWTRLGPTS